ncbi:hypothetical protein ACWD0J_30880 [Streptomyces sp. NPDC003011]
MKEFSSSDAGDTLPEAARTLHDTYAAAYRVSRSTAIAIRASRSDGEGEGDEDGDGARPT